MEVTRWSLRELARLRGWDEVYIGHHTFFVWDQGNPTARLAPDLYLLDGQPTGPDVMMWEAWKPGFRRSRWALEVVSEDWRKDYVDNLPKYAQLDCSELVVFDYQLLWGPPADVNELRKPLTIFRPRKDGRLHADYSGNGPACSRELKVWLVARLEGQEPMIRLWLDEAGKRVVPTEEEARGKAARELDEMIRQSRQLEEEIRQLDEQMAERMRRAGLDPGDDP